MAWLNSVSSPKGRAVVCGIIAVLLAILIVEIVIGNRWSEEKPLAAATLAVAGILVIGLTRDTVSLIAGVVIAVAGAVAYFDGPVVLGWWALGIGTALEGTKWFVERRKARAAAAAAAAAAQTGPVPTTH